MQVLRRHRRTIGAILLLAVVVALTSVAPFLFASIFGAMLADGAAFPGITAEEIAAQERVQVVIRQNPLVKEVGTGRHSFCRSDGKCTEYLNIHIVPRDSATVQHADAKQMAHDAMGVFPDAATIDIARVIVVERRGIPPIFTFTSSQSFDFARRELEPTPASTPTPAIVPTLSDSFAQALNQPAPLGCTLVEVATAQVQIERDGLGREVRSVEFVPAQLQVGEGSVRPRCAPGRSEQLDRLWQGELTWQERVRGGTEWTVARCPGRALLTKNGYWSVVTRPECRE